MAKQKKARRGGEDKNLLELTKYIPSELGPALRDVDPQAAMPADAGGALNGKADGHGLLARLGSQVNVLAGDLGRAVVVQRQQVNFVGYHCLWDHGGRKESRARETGGRGMMRGVSRAYPISLSLDPRRIVGSVGNAFIIRALLCPALLENVTCTMEFRAAGQKRESR
jgi:hypothetical protein